MRALPTLGPIPFRHGLGNSIEMLRAALALLGVEADVTDLLGLSGAAFRIYWRAPANGPDAGEEWDPDVSQVCAIDASATACRPFGWRLLRYRNIPGQVAYQFALQSIARGLPLLSYGFVGEPEDVIVVGCERTAGARGLLVRTRHAVEAIRFDLEDGPWPGTDHRGTCVALLAPLPPRGRVPFDIEVHRALRRAVWLARLPGLPGRGDYRCGPDAYRAWIDSLIRTQTAPGASAAAERLGIRYGIVLPHDPAARERIGIRHVMHRALADLSLARRGAAEFLRRHMSIRPTGGAAALFEREAVALEEAVKLWPSVIAGEYPRFRLEVSIDEVDPVLLRKETARCLRIAGEAHTRAVEEIERTVPPTEEELIADEEETD